MPGLGLTLSTSLARSVLRARAALDVGTFSQDDSWVLAARDDRDLGRGIACLRFSDWVAGVASIVVDLFCLQQVCAVC